jgi:hypothetical protein
MMWRRRADDDDDVPSAFLPQDVDSSPSSVSSGYSSSRDLTRHKRDDDGVHFSGVDEWPDSYHSSREEGAAMLPQGAYSDDLDDDARVQKHIEMATHSPLLRQGMGDPAIGDTAGTVDE